MADKNPRNARIIEQFHANGGDVPSNVAPGAPLLLLHTVGAKSGQPRINPMRFQPISEGVVAVFASNRGLPNNPDWYYNVKANPNVAVEIGTEVFSATARILTGAERDEVWEREKAEWPVRQGYEEKSGDREIPVILLELAPPRDQLVVCGRTPSRPGYNRGGSG
jgi:deazaflavin-dependent oxidoreductase (nitroreductase family)